MMFEKGLNKFAMRRRAEQTRQKLSEDLDRLNKSFFGKWGAIHQCMVEGPAAQAKRLLRGRAETLQREADALNLPGMAPGILGRAEHALKIGDRLAPEGMEERDAAASLEKGVDALRTSATVAKNRATFLGRKAKNHREDISELALLKRALY